MRLALALAIALSSIGCSGSREFLIRESVLERAESMPPWTRKVLAVPAVRSDDGEPTEVLLRRIDSVQEEPGTPRRVRARVGMHPAALAGLVLLSLSAASTTVGVAGAVSDMHSHPEDASPASVVGFSLGLVFLLPGTIVGGVGLSRPVEVDAEDPRFQHMNAACPCAPWMPTGNCGEERPRRARAATPTRRTDEEDNSVNPLEPRVSPGDQLKPPDWVPPAADSNP